MLLPEIENEIPSNIRYVQSNQAEATIIEGDCLDVLKALPDGCIQLVITSPPYADARAKQYGGVPPDKYVEWFLPISAELLRVLRPDGTFILNIKERVVDGERSNYVLRLILALQDQGWRWTEEFIWSKKNAMPGKWNTRFRDAWERLLQFNKSKKFKMNQGAVLQEPKTGTVKRAQCISKNDLVRVESGSASPFGRSMENCLGRHRQNSTNGSVFGKTYRRERNNGSGFGTRDEKCYPTKVLPSNVLYLAPETKNTGHPAAYPEAIPDFFVRLFTDEGDFVLDPFAGSGTTGVVALKHGRSAVLIELSAEYCELIEKRLNEVAAQTPAPQA